MKIRLAIAALAAFIFAAGCGINQTQVLPPHPNQVSPVDGMVYDGLLGLKGAIDNAKQEYAAGQIPASAKPVINDAIAVYDRAVPDWKAYRKAAAKSHSAATSGPQYTAVMADYAEVESSVSRLTTLGGGK